MNIKKAIFFSLYIFTLSENLEAMHYFDEIKDQTEKIFLCIARCQKWTRFCNYLIYLGKEVESCDSYKGETWDTNPDNVLVNLNYQDMAHPNKFLILSSMRLFAQLMPSTSVPYDYNAEGFEPFNFNYEEPTWGSQRLCFDSNTGKNICCKLYPGLNMVCYRNNNPELNIWFNLLDNLEPQYNCCVVEESGILRCSIPICELKNSRQSPCNAQTREPNFAKTKSIISKKLEGYTSTVFDDPHSYEMIIAYLRNIEKKFGINQEHAIQKIENSNYIAISFDNNISTLKVNYFNSQHCMEMQYDYAHEVAHAHQYELLANDMFQLKPGSEISADIMGSIATDYKSLDFFAFKIQRYNAWEIMKNKLEMDLPDTEMIYELTKNICKMDLPNIDRSNALNIANLLRTHSELFPHPTKLNRAVILLKLSTMIKAVIKYFETVTH